ncbi:MAG: T9SS type A sorting domain-containing protein [Saprospiraceae bacterium]
MKKIFIILVAILSMQIVVNSQSCGINYDYDNAGNRIERYQCITSPMIGNETVVKQIIEDLEIVEIEQRNIDNLNSFVVFPNPTSGYFYIEKKDLSSNASVYIFSEKGSMILKQPYGSGEFDISDFLSGVYFIVVTENKNTSIAKIVKLN